MVNLRIILGPIRSEQNQSSSKHNRAHLKSHHLWTLCISAVSICHLPGNYFIPGVSLRLFRRSLQWTIGFTYQLKAVLCVQNASIGGECTDISG